MRLILIILILSLLSTGCIVRDADRFQIGGEVRVETSGILEYITGFKFRVFGGILLERTRKGEKHEKSETLLPLDAFLTDIGK